MREDVLFQDFHREQPSSRTSSAHDASKGNPVSESSETSSAPLNATTKTLSEHIDSIISADLSSSNSVSSYHQHGHPPRSVAYPFHLAGPAPPSTVASQVIDDHAAWKRRIVDKPGGPSGGPQGAQGGGAQGTTAQGTAQDERTNIRIIQPPSPRGKIMFQVEPVSPPDSASASASGAPAHHWLPGGAAGTPVSVPTSVVGGLSVPSAGPGPAPDHMAFSIPRRYYPDPKQLSPLEYVNNKIVEVMRTSEDDKESRSKGDDRDGRADKEARSSPADGYLVMEDGRSGTPHAAEKASPQPASTAPPVSQPQQSPYVPSSTYAYPFSALSVPQTGGAPPAAAVAKAPGATASILSKTSEADSARQQEPKPILSAQYEPLSDED